MESARERLPWGGIPHPITDGELVEEYLGFLTPRAEGPALRAVLKRFVVLRRVEPQAPTAVSCSKAHPERLPLVPCLIFHAPPRASWDHLLREILAREPLSQQLHPFTVLRLRRPQMLIPCNMIWFGFSFNWASMAAQMVKNLPPKQQVYPGSIPGLGRLPGKRNGYLLQYPWLKNSMDRGGWWATVHRVTKSGT